MKAGRRLRQLMSGTGWGVRFWNFSGAVADLPDRGRAMKRAHGEQKQTRRDGSDRLAALPVSLGVLPAQEGR